MGASLGNLAAEGINNFLQKLGQRYPFSGRIYLLGGGALCLLGNPRRTVDIDYTLDENDKHLEELKNAVYNLALQEKLELELIPIQEFIPLPLGNETRHLKIAQFGKLEVHVFDPYSIALSKLARGFDSDIQDVLFLLDNGFILIADLTGYVEKAKENAWDYDINPVELQTRLNDILHRFK